MRENLEEIANNIETVKILARDSIKKKENQLSDEMKALSSKLTSFIDENVDDMMKERKVMTNRIDKEYSNIK